MIFVLNSSCFVVKILASDHLFMCPQTRFTLQLRCSCVTVSVLPTNQLSVMIILHYLDPHFPFPYESIFASLIEDCLTQLFLWIKILLLPISPACNVHSNHMCPKHLASVGVTHVFIVIMEVMTMSFLRFTGLVTFHVLWISSVARHICALWICLANSNL